MLRKNHWAIEARGKCQMILEAKVSMSVIGLPTQKPNLPVRHPESHEDEGPRAEYEE